MDEVRRWATRRGWLFRRHAVPGWNERWELLRFVPYADPTFLITAEPALTLDDAHSGGPADRGRGDFLDRFILYTPPDD